ncbi:Alpha beta hydrolase fold protein [Mycena sanguinolenta]|uniref:Alpha beta hydrolase fold protein n=1 Tax=Mycena sanguinolenta TaxID=230812 RepID=A0A8H6XZN2_9AGAR|nr:Alpha beta hydrolase fold protein [Mycena sanguinolenta]
MNPSAKVPRLPFFTRLKYALLAFVLQNFRVKPKVFFRAWKYYLSPPKIRPDIVKTYACRPHLPIRIFFPRSSKPTSNLPALFTIHGGGFVVGEPTHNESWNRTFADTHGMIVVALNYAKAPGSPFPGPVYDIEVLFVSALADPSIPIDPACVALAGWSTGGNLAVAASQLETVRPHLRALVPLYPVLDLGLDVAIKAQLRRYKTSLGGFRARAEDLLLEMTALFKWCYEPVGQEYRDPLLSPLYAAREALPKHVFVIGCELDLFRARSLAVRVETGRPGRARFHFEAKTADGGTYRWLLVPDAVHGFDGPYINEIAHDSEMTEDGLVLKRGKVIVMIGQWLLAGPLKKA